MGTLKGENAPSWKPVVGKTQVHRWLDANFGKQRVCENKECKGKGNWFDWALKKNCKYERRKENFLRLCRSCHRRYDLTEEKKRQAIKNLWWKKGIKNPGEVYKGLQGKWSQRYDKCVDCGKSDYKYKSNGMCIKCYYKFHYQKYEKGRLANRVRKTL